MIANGYDAFGKTKQQFCLETEFIVLISAVDFNWAGFISGWIKLVAIYLGYNPKILTGLEPGRVGWLRLGWNPPTIDNLRRPIESVLLDF